MGGNGQGACGGIEHVEKGRGGSRVREKRDEQRGKEGGVTV